MNAEKFCSGADRAARLMKSLSSAPRLRILCRLHTEECSVGDLEDFVGVSQSALSQHLARLRREGLVTTRRAAQTIYYRIADQNAVRVIEQLYALYCDAPGRGKGKRGMP